jgi:L-ascorbate metabolism protein UlaG (beta-lactamase superfamily)
VWGLTDKGARAETTNPALEIDRLPPLDLVVLSHMHDDRFDRVAAAKLDKNVQIVTTQAALLTGKRKALPQPKLSILGKH